MRKRICFYDTVFSQPVFWALAALVFTVLFIVHHI